MIDNFDLFIFDWDGTLSTSTSLVKLTRLLKPRYYLRRIQEQGNIYRGLKPLNPARLGLKAYELEERDRFFSFLYSIYSAVERPRMREGSFELIRLLKSRGKKVAVLSDSRLRRLMDEISMAKLDGRIDLVVSADMINVYKPDPRGIELVARRMGIKKSRCVYIGDMASDIMTAKFAGVASCAIEGGFESAGHIVAAKPNYMFRSVMEMYRKLRGE